MRPLSGFSRPRASLENRALARPGHAEDGFGFAARQLERDAVEHRLVFEGDGNVLEHDDIAPGRLLGGSRRAEPACGSGRSRHAFSDSQKHHQEPGHEHIDHDDQDHRSHHGLGGRAPDALRAALGRQSVVAAHGGDDKAEDHGFTSPMNTSEKTRVCQALLQYSCASRPSSRLATKLPPSRPMKSPRIVRKNSMTTVADHARRHQLLHGIGAQRAHGVDLLGHNHRAKFAGHARSIASGDDQAGQHRPQFPHDANRDQLSNDGVRAEPAQGGGAVQRQRRAGEEARRPARWAASRSRSGRPAAPCRRHSEAAGTDWPPIAPARSE